MNTNAIDKSKELILANTSSQNILSIFYNLKHDESWEFREATRKETSYASHGYHRYPAKFIPQLARRCIEEYSKKDDMVFDPFMGCGTTLVEALISGRKTCGIDINPVAYLITKAKLTPIEPNKLDDEVNKLIKDVENYPDSNISPIIPNNKRIDYWFPHEDIKEELGILLGRINQIKDEDIKYFMLCCFSNILKNCSIWLMKSIKPTRDLKKIPTKPLTAFKRHVKVMIRGNNELYNLTSLQSNVKSKEHVDVKVGDAKNVPFPDNYANLIVTSPPYVTSYEYADLHQLSALWLRYCDDIREFRKNFIGSVYNRNISNDKTILSNIFYETIEAELKTKSKKEYEATKKYFIEMQDCFYEMYRILDNDGIACIVIGNTELKKVKILNAQIFVEIMLNIGFDIEKIVKRRIPSKNLPSTRDAKTGKFTSVKNADKLAYPSEYILIMRKK